MRILRKLFIMLLVTGLIFVLGSLAFAGGNEATKGKEEEGFAVKTIKIRVGHDQPEKSPHHEAALKWKEMVETQTKGRVKVEIYPSQLLGTGKEMVEMLQTGALEVGIIPSAKVSTIVPMVQILDLPFLFPSREICYKVIDGEAGKKILEPLLQKNIYGAAFWESGFKQFTGDFPINKPSDYKGKKIRIMPTPVIKEQFLAFGASPVPIDFHELYNALQQGVVDGEENPIVTIYTMKFYEVQKYLTMSNHAYLSYIFMFNKKFLENLPEDIQKILISAAKAAGQYERRLVAENEEGYLEIFKKAGMEIINLSPEQRNAFEEVSKPVYQWFVDKYGEDGKNTLNLVKKEIEGLQK